MSKQLVKDRVIKYLIEDLLVPQDMIDTDVALSEFEEGADGILDVIVNVKDTQDYYAPVMVIQCLDEDIKLEGEVVKKQLEYLEDIDNITMAGRMALTNGNDMMYFDWKGEEYDTEAAIPTYEVMVAEFNESEKLAEEHENHHNHDHDCGCGHDHSDEHQCCGGHSHDCGCGDDCGCKH